MTSSKRLIRLKDGWRIVRKVGNLLAYSQSMPQTTRRRRTPGQVQSWSLKFMNRSYHPTNNQSLHKEKSAAQLLLSSRHPSTPKERSSTSLRTPPIPLRNLNHTVPTSSVGLSTRIGTRVFVTRLLAREASRRPSFPSDSTWKWQVGLSSPQTM